VSRRISPTITSADAFSKPASMPTARHSVGRATVLAPHLSEAYWYLAIALWDQCRYYEAAESFISAANGHPRCIGAIGSLENLVAAHPDLRGELGERLDEFRVKFRHFYPIEVPRFREFEIRDRLPKWFRRLMGRTHETPGSRSIRLES